MSALFKISVVTIITCFGLLFISNLFLKHTSVIYAAQVISTHHWAFALWRYGLYSIVLIIWPYFIRKIGTKQKWLPQIICCLSNQRFKLISFFMFIEAFLVYNLLGHLLAAV